MRYLVGAEVFEEKDKALAHATALAGRAAKDARAAATEAKGSELTPAESDAIKGYQFVAVESMIVASDGSIEHLSK